MFRLVKILNYKAVQYCSILFKDVQVYMSCISETACFPANCVELMHLDSLPVGRECV